MNNTNGLQRGNLVTLENPSRDHLTGKRFVIDEIYQSAVSLKFQLESRNSITEFIETVQPLSITPETLGLFEQFRYTADDLLHCKIRDFFIRYMPNSECCEVWSHGNLVVKCKSIHHLQNIVSVLTGEYLQLKQQEK